MTRGKSFFMNIKTKIGRRITEARNKAGYTIKQLAAKTVDLSPSRISNWEQGTRKPGPAEVKQLAVLLNVSPAYLLCLVDDDSISHEYSGSTISRALPLLNFSDVNTITSLNEAIETSRNNKELIPVTKTLSEKIGTHAFCLRLTDESMLPEFRVNDVVIIDPHLKPKPGQFILATLNNEEIPLLRKYRELEVKQIKNRRYELVSLNNDWPNVIVDHEKMKATIIGVVVGAQRIYE